MTAVPKATTTASEGSPKLLTTGEQVETNKVLPSPFSVDYEQTFHLTLNGFGECVFASTTRKDKNNEFIVIASGTTYPLPKFTKTESWTPHKVKAVWFGKLNKDNLTDVITITDYMTGIGPTGTEPFPVVQYFYASGPKTFQLDEAASKKATEKGISTLSDARDFLNGKLPENQCTGDNSNSELPCTLKNGFVGWCKGGVCKTVCPTGYSYDPLDTQCHQPRDCKPAINPDGTLKSVKTAKCNSCMSSVCFDTDAIRPMLE